VGNYDISVAPTLADLDSRVDWSKFDLPADFQSRKATLSNPALYPAPCAYVIAQAVESIANDGFGVIYDAPTAPPVSGAWFPTAHEQPQGSTVVDYEVELYHFATSTVNIQDPLKSASYHLTDAKTVSSLLSLLPNSCKLSANGQTSFVSYPQATVINYCSVHGSGKNANVLV
jgi:hypothetical protein